MATRTGKIIDDLSSITASTNASLASNDAWCADALSSLRDLATSIFDLPPPPPPPSAPRARARPRPQHHPPIAKRRRPPRDRAHLARFHDKENQPVVAVAAAVPRKRIAAAGVLRERPAQASPPPLRTRAGGGARPAPPAAEAPPSPPPLPAARARPRTSAEAPRPRHSSLDSFSSALSRPRSPAPGAAAPPPPSRDAGDAPGRAAAEARGSPGTAAVVEADAEGRDRRPGGRGMRDGAPALSDGEASASDSDAEFEDARGDSDWSGDEQPDHMDTSPEDAASLQPVDGGGGLLPGPGDDDIEARVSGIAKKRLPKQSEKGKARPRKIARTEDILASPTNSADTGSERQSLESQEDEDAGSEEHEVSSPQNPASTASIAEGAQNTSSAVDGPPDSNIIHQQDVIEEKRNSNETENAAAEEEEEEEEVQSSDPESQSKDNGYDEETPVVRRKRRPRKVLISEDPLPSPQPDKYERSGHSGNEAKKEMPTQPCSGTKTSLSPQACNHADSKSREPPERKSVLWQSTKPSISTATREDTTNRRADSDDNTVHTHSGNGDASITAARKTSDTQNSSPAEQEMQKADANVNKSPIISYKMPKARQRPATTGFSAQKQNLQTLTSRQPFATQNPHTPQQSSIRSIANANPNAGSLRERNRFIVDENGKLGQNAIGALSEILSTPSTISRANGPTAAAQLDQGSVRTARLFRPPSTIYSAKKSGLSVQRSQGLKPAVPILHTPGARTPGKQKVGEVPLSTDSVMNGLISRSFGPPSLSQKLAVPMNEGHSKLDNCHTLQKKKVLCRELSYREPVITPSSNTGTRSLRFGKQLKFSTVGLEVQRDNANTDACHSNPESLPKLSAGDVGTKYPSALKEPKTAPGQRAPRPRIDGKQVKSALRCRIERMLARPSATTQNHQESDMSLSPKVPHDSHPEKSKGRNSSIDKSEPEAILVPSASTIQTAKTAKTASHTVKVDRGRLPMEKHVDHLQENISSGGTELLLTTQKSKSSPKAKHVRQTSSAESNIRKGDATDGVEINSPQMSHLDAEASAKNRSTDRLSAGEQSDDKSTDQTQSNLASSTSSFMNLVSSVSSFLPKPDMLVKEFKSEEKRASFEARQALKRQKQDLERREAEVLARREAQRAAKQKEAGEKQRKVEERRRVIAEADKHRKEEARRKELLRAQKRQEEEEKQRTKKEEEDKRKEEHRRHVLEQKRKMDKAAMRKDTEVKRNGKTSKLPKPRIGQPGTLGSNFKLKQQQRPGQLQTRLPPTGSSRSTKALTSDNMPPPRTPRVDPAEKDVEEPQWVLTGERRPGVFETSLDERERRRNKTAPSWAGSRKLWHALQSDKSDPDTLFARGAPSCNLETVFDVDEEKKRKYRTRDESGDWTRDRLTAQEEMHYKRQAGFFDNA